MVTALDQPEDRVKGLEAGADDFLTKPVNDLALFCRVKSLVRLKMLTDELRARSPPSTGSARRPPGLQVEADAKPGQGPRHRQSLQQASAPRRRSCPATRSPSWIDPMAAVMHAPRERYELIIINLDMENVDGLRLCSQLKSLERTRQTPILIIVDPDDHQRLLRALDMGVNDYLIRPIDKQELLARVNTQIRRCRYTEQLRSQCASVDGACGHRSPDRPLQSALHGKPDSGARRASRSIAARCCRCSLSTSITSRRSTITHGHDVGDRVLQELA